MGAENATKSKAGPSSGLPAVLLASIKVELPGYSLPDAKAGAHPYTRYCQTSTPSPFYAVGDFTGSGHQEFSVVLTGPEKLLFVIFSPDAAGKPHLIYRARTKTAEDWGQHRERLLIERPEQIELCAVHRGEAWAPEAGDTVKELRPETDAVAIHTHPLPDYDLQSLILYKDGAFHQLFFEPLVVEP